MAKVIAKEKMKEVATTMKMNFHQSQLEDPANDVLNIHHSIGEEGIAEEESKSGVTKNGCHPIPVVFTKKFKQSLDFSGIIRKKNVVPKLSRNYEIT